MSLELLKCFLLTVLIEIAVLRIIGEKNINVYIASIIINLITNVPLNIFLYLYSFSDITIYYCILISLEIFILIIEGFMYYLVLKNYKKSFLYSILANLASFAFGNIIIYLVDIIFS